MLHLHGDQVKQSHNVNLTLYSARIIKSTHRRDHISLLPSSHCSVIRVKCFALIL